MNREFSGHYSRGSWMHSVSAQYALCLCACQADQPLVGKSDLTHRPSNFWFWMGAPAFFIFIRWFASKESLMPPVQEMLSLLDFCHPGCLSPLRSSLMWNIRWAFLNIFDLSPACAWSIFWKQEALEALSLRHSLMPASKVMLWLPWAWAERAHALNQCDLEFLDQAANAHEKWSTENIGKFTTF